MSNVTGEASTGVERRSSLGMVVGDRIRAVLAQLMANSAIAERVEDVISPSDAWRHIAHVAVAVAHLQEKLQKSEREESALRGQLEHTIRELDIESRSHIVAEESLRRQYAEHAVSLNDLQNTIDRQEEKLRSYLGMEEEHSAGMASLKEAADREVERLRADLEEARNPLIQGASDDIDAMRRTVAALRATEGIRIEVNRKQAAIIGAFGDERAKWEAERSRLSAEIGRMEDVEAEVAMWRRLHAEAEALTRRFSPPATAPADTLEGA